MSAAPRQKVGKHDGEADEAFHYTFTTMFLRAILAGWLIALMIWLLPFAVIPPINQ